MNKRIKELSKQAVIALRAKNSPELPPLTDNAIEQILKLREEYDAIFVELIVKECVCAIDTVYEQAKPDHVCYDWATFAESDDILNHFGMK